MPDPTSDTLDRIRDRIAQAAPSGVWTRADFLDIGTPNAVEKALQRLAKRGDIRRPYRGLYDKPGTSALTGLSQIFCINGMLTIGEEIPLPE